MEQGWQGLEGGGQRAGEWIAYAHEFCFPYPNYWGSGEMGTRIRQAEGLGMGRGV